MNSFSQVLSELRLYHKIPNHIPTLESKKFSKFNLLQEHDFNVKAKFLNKFSNNERFSTFSIKSKSCISWIRARIQYLPPKINHFSKIP